MLFLATLAAGGTSLAQGGDDFRKKEAEERYKEGLVLHEKGREEEARVKFEQAYAALKRPNILFSLARSEQLTGRPVEAIVHYRMYLGEAKESKDARFRTLASDNLATLYREVGRLEITSPEGVKVTVDGEVASEAMLKDSVPVKAGAHVVVGQSGDKKFEKKVTVGAGEVLKVTVVFESAPSPVPPPTPTPTTTTSAAVPAPSASASYTYTPPPKDEPTGGGSVMRYVVPVGIAAVGAGAIVGGFVFRSAGNTKSDEASALVKGLDCTTANVAACGEARAKADDAKTQKNLGLGLWIGGGAAVVGAVVTYLVWPTSKSAWVAPVVGPREAGLGMGGRF